MHKLKCNCVGNVFAYFDDFLRFFFLFTKKFYIVEIHQFIIFGFLSLIVTTGIFRWSRLEPIARVPHDQWNAHRSATSVPAGTTEPAHHHQDSPDDTENILVRLPTNHGRWIRCIRILRKAVPPSLRDNRKSAFIYMRAQFIFMQRQI